jgi:hypothetical protein
MSQEPIMPTVAPDYQSESNWNAFLALFPEEERVLAPSYAEAAENLDKLEESAAFTGLDLRRVKVDVAEWKSWVEANNQSYSRHTVPMFAMYKFAQEATGEKDLGVRFSNR